MPVEKDQATSTGNDKPWRILLAEDDKVTRMVFKRTLQKQGFSVEDVSNGREALEILEERYFPILITDWNMPEMTGPELCAAVREMEPEHYIYILMVTAEHDTEHVVSGLAAGADDFLRKPVVREELLARLQTGVRILDLIGRLEIANAQIAAISDTDELTECWNRRRLGRELPNEIERATRFCDPLSLVLCDIDHFKRVNDKYGHLTGDAVLRWFVRSVKASLRDGVDWLARYGGEEFLIVLPRTELEDAVGVAERIRVIIASEVCHVDGHEISITSSFGVCCHRFGTGQPKPAAEALIERADQLLYRCKREGRNRSIGASFLE